MLHMSAQCYEHRLGYCTNAKTCFNVHIGAILAKRRVLLGAAADGWPLMWVNGPLQVSQPGQLSLSSSRGRWMSSKAIIRCVLPRFSDANTPSGEWLPGKGQAWSDCWQKNFAPSVSGSLPLHAKPGCCCCPAWQCVGHVIAATGEALHCSKIVKSSQSLPLQMAERLPRAQPDSVTNHVTARSISDWRALTWLATCLLYTSPSPRD